MRLHFLGGSFDPPHLGHLKIAEFFENSCDLFLFIPAKKSPFKNSIPHANSKHRFNMLNLMTENFKYIDVDNFELKSDAESFTYLTVEYLIEKYNPTELSMIIGKDNLFGLENWKNIEYIQSNCKIICVDRNLNDNKISFNKSIKIHPFNSKISSTEIRNLLNINNHNNLSTKLDRKVFKYILKNNLYSSKIN